MAFDPTAVEQVRDHRRCLPRRIRKRDQALAENVAELAKVLADPIRLQVLDLLRSADDEVCQCDLQPLFGVSQPTLSHHLKKLTDAGMVEVERRGKWAYYSLNDEPLDVLRSWLC